ncbi:MAG: hypothetical protein ACSHYB_09690 [Roseibacillus sp.]
MTTLKSVAIVAGLASSAFGQATSPVVGYETISLLNDSFNLAGVRLHGKAAVESSFTSSTDTTLVDSSAPFGALDAGTTYVVELADGSFITALGSDFSADTLTVAAGGLTGMEQGFTLRTASTLDSVFGAANTAGLTSSTTGNPVGTDKVWVPNGTGGFTQYFHADVANFGTGWVEVGTTTFVGDSVVLEPGVGFFIVTEGTASPASVVISGAVKTNPTMFSVNQEFNLLSSEYPAGLTLDESGLSAFVTASTTGNPVGADAVWIPNGTGGFTQYFFADIPNFGSGWAQVGTTTFVGDTVELTSGFYLVDTDGSGGGAISAPSFYSSL